MLRNLTRTTIKHASKGARAMSMAPKIVLPKTGALIDGQWHSSSNTFETINPATEEVIAAVTNAGAEEVNHAVEAATIAFYEGEWGKMGGYGRGKLLNRLADLIEANMEELAMLEVLDNGKSMGEAMFADLPLTIQCYRYYAGWADKIHGQVVSPSGPITGVDNIFGYIEKEPVGVVGQIIPWNFPLLMMAWKLGPALAAGCTSVLKVAPQTPLSALRIGELLLEAGLPPGVVNILPGDDNCGKLVAAHPGFDKLAFTGSTGVGRKIMMAAAQANNMKRVTLELGGKSPIIVFNDADIDNAVAHAHTGLFLNQGQCCCAGSRIFVEDGVYDEFVSKSVTAAKERKVGPGWETQTQQGPQVSQEQLDTVLGYINQGKAAGATLLAGGEAVSHGGKGFFVEPTVFADVTDDMAIAEEEIFGPVMSIMKFSDIDEVVARANNTDYGLAAAIFSKDLAKARMTAKRIRAGTIWINCYDTFDASLPFGGFKSSGIGRELGEAGLANYLESKTMAISMG